MRVTNPDRVYFPQSGATKLDLVEYYLAVGDGIVNALFERPCMLHRFPKGLAGRDLDPLARYPLWLAGQDFNHGTGHGVGVYLCVHEGPQRLSRISHVPQKPGMILSNEPGYYREGAFGIRIENLIVVQDAPPLDTADPEREMYAFDTLTWVPIDRRLILPALMDAGEIDWLNRYHAACRDKIGPRVSDAARLWLAAATEPL